MSGEGNNYKSSSGGNRSSNNKRSYMHSKSNKNKYQPKRGGPGIILTCHTGQERKCQREGLEIINYYYRRMMNNSNSNSSQKEESKEEEEKKPPAASLSLDDELAQLQSQNQKSKTNNRQHHENLVHNGPFAVYDTGCRGTIFVMNTKPNCSLLPNLGKLFAEKASVANEQSKIEGDDVPGEEEKETSEEPASKKQKTDESSEEKEDKKEKKVDDNNHQEPTSTTTDQEPPSHQPWDPRDIVRKVVADLLDEITSKSRKSGIPGSRFVTRMIPMQATCFASMEEISVTFGALLNRLVLVSSSSSNNAPPPNKDSTFSVVFKRRNCGHITREQVIESCVEQVFGNEATKDWKVKLKEPDYQIQVEICCTLCGISILHASKEDSNMTSRNFNVADLRGEAAEARNNDD